MDDRQWRDFRDSIFSRPDTAAGSRSTPGSTAEAAAGKPRVSKPLSRGASGPARVAIPALAVITLFVVSMFAIVIPQVHGMLLEHKKETIQGIAESVEELASCSVAILDHVRAMDAAGGKARHIVRLLTEAHDLTVRKLVDLSLLRSGEAPCAWAFVVLGSAGRGELLPGSDQDNAIIFDPASGNGDAERPWFLGLGEYLCDSLERTGIPKCRHGLMARNPDWCAPRAEWEARYAHWVEEPESGRIVNLNALIDIRPVAGSSDLVASIRGSFESAVARTPSFLVHLANSARNLRIPGAPMVDPAGAKEAAGLFPAFVRVYATKAGLRQTNTFARLDALAAAGILWDDTARESTESYEILLKNRLALGLGASGKPGRILETMTKVALSQAVVLQKRIGFDFPGLPA
jgi:signal-transduction protein with cAMP-binding, CBS, and nucleotidyltransferase domain